MEKTKNILVIDCIGNGIPQIITEGKYIKLGFPIKNVDKLKEKISLLSADFEKLMHVYHSDLDDGRGIDLKYVNSAFRRLLKEMA